MTYNARVETLPTGWTVVILSSPQRVGMVEHRRLLDQIKERYSELVVADSLFVTHGVIAVMGPDTKRKKK